MVIFRTATADFGDSQTSLALRVAQDKYIAPNCMKNLGKMEAEDPFAHNYLFSGHSKVIAAFVLNARNLLAITSSAFFHNTGKI